MRNVCRKDTERQLGEAKRGLAEASRDGQAAAARIKALHVELEEVSFSIETGSCWSWLLR